MPVSGTTSGARGGAPPVGSHGRAGLREVVADVAEDVLDLTPKEDHGDDHGDRDDGNDERVLDQSLTAVVAEEIRQGT